MMEYVTVPRPDEVLVAVVGLLVRARPEDRLRLAHEWRADAICGGEGLMLPEPAALVWLAGYLERTLEPRAVEAVGNDRPGRRGGALLDYHETAVGAA